MSTQPVVAAVDGSQESLHALDWALDAARRREAPLRIVHVRQYTQWTRSQVLAAGPPAPEEDPVLDQVRRHMELHAALPDVEYVTLEGAPGALLPEMGAAARLLVLGSRGRGGFASLLLGSNSLAAARDAECPVVVVPRPKDDGGAPSRSGGTVVVGLKSDSPDEATLAFAFAEAALRGARLRIVTAYPWPLQTWLLPGEMPPADIDQDAVEHETRVLAEGLLTAHRERHPEVATETDVLPGDAAGHLVEASREAQLVVVGRHRRRLLAPARMMGSVTQAVLLHAGSPVAVVPQAPPEEA